MITTKDAELIVVNSLLVHVNNQDTSNFTASELKKFEKAQAKFEKRLIKFRDTLLKQLGEAE